MKYLLQLLFVSAFILSSNTQVNAQANKSKESVVVVLTDGSMFSGELISWKVGEEITIITESGTEFTFPGDKIEKVMQESLYVKSINFKPKTPYNFKETGRYYSIRGQLIDGNNGRRSRDVYGAGASFLIGERFSRLLGVGVGIGADQYIFDTGENIYSVFAEASGYLKPKHTTLFYTLAAGYGRGFNNQDFGIVDTKGGWLLYPSIGLRFGRGAKKFTVDAGYKFQKAAFTYSDAWEPRNRSEQRLLYKRVSLRFGVLF